MMNYKGVGPGTYQEGLRETINTSVSVSSIPVGTFFSNVTKCPSGSFINNSMYEQSSILAQIVQAVNIFEELKVLPSGI
jgi:hypothetical protein